jgi:hypothetical protein
MQPFCCLLCVFIHQLIASYTCMSQYPGQMNSKGSSAVAQDSYGVDDGSQDVLPWLWSVVGKCLYHGLIV